MNSLKRYSVWHIAPTQKEFLKPLNQVLTNAGEPVGRTFTTWIIRLCHIATRKNSFIDFGR